MSNVKSMRWYCPTCEMVTGRHPLIGKGEMPDSHKSAKDEKKTCFTSLIPQVYSPQTESWVLDVHSNLN